MNTWQQVFLKELYLKDININESDFKQVYDFMLKQIPYPKRRAIMNFASLVRQSLYNEDMKQSSNYKILQKRAQEYIKEIRPSFEMVFEIGTPYITAYNEMQQAQLILQEKNKRLYALEQAWNKKEGVPAKEESNLFESSKKVINQEQIEKAKTLPLENLGLNPASYNRLKRADIHNTYQLCCMSEKQILSLKGIGKKNLECIKQRLDRNGYTIGMLIN